MDFPLGIGLLIVAAVMNGNFALPMKATRRWSWETTWLTYTVAAQFLLPWLVVSSAVPAYRTILAQTPWSEILVPVLFGIGWGVAQVLYGLGLARLGIALGSSIIVGIAATLGACIPLLVLHPEKLWSREGLSLMAGIAVMLVGIALCGMAGHARETGRAMTRRDYFGALALCIASGLLAPMMTLALAFGGGVLRQAAAHGVQPASATYLIWLLALPAGATISIFYCVHLLRRRRTWPEFLAPRMARNWALAILMAVLWIGGTLLYGASTVYLGPLGVSLAQTLFVIFVVVGVNAGGFLTGEWKGVARSVIVRQVAGVSLLVLACSVATAGNW
jgi:L-rhamnose-H+ transport protein